MKGTFLPPKNARPSATASSPADELNEESAEPLTYDDAQMTDVELSAYLASGLAGVTIGAKIEDAAKHLPILIDQDDLIEQPFVALNVRIQPKTILIGDRREVQYEMVIAAVQPVELDAEDKVAEGGDIFIMVAGRTNSVLGREMYSACFGASPANPILFARGLRRVDLGGGQWYYTTQPERDPHAKVNLFPKRNVVAELPA